MTQQQAQERNFKIHQLRGILPRLVHLIPADIAEKLPHEDLVDLAEICDRITYTLDVSRKVVTLCPTCANSDAYIGRTPKRASIEHTWCDGCNHFFGGTGLLRNYELKEANNEQ